MKCGYDEKNKCDNCKYEKVCPFLIPTNPSLDKIQLQIRDILQQIHMIKKDIQQVQEIQGFIDAGYYKDKTNIFGDPILEVQDVANYPTLSELKEELHDLQFELKLWRSKEFEEIKRIGDEL